MEVVMLTYCEAIPHSPTVLVLRLRRGDGPDWYDARDTATDRFVSGLGSYKAALAALGAESS